MFISRPVIDGLNRINEHTNAFELFRRKPSEMTYIRKVCFLKAGTLIPTVTMKDVLSVIFLSSPTSHFYGTIMGLS